MRPTDFRLARRRGGALILTLLFMGVVTAGFVTWVTIIRQRGRVAVLGLHQVRKRLAFTNAEVMARDYLLRRAVASNGDNDGLTGNTNGGSTWSTVDQTSWLGNSQNTTVAWTGYAMDSNTKWAGLNAWSPAYDYPYSKALNFVPNYKRLYFVDTASDPEKFANDTTSVRGYVRSHNTLLGGDLLVLHRPTPTVTTTLPTVTGNINVYGRVVHFAPDVPSTGYTVRSERFISPGQLNLNVLPANLAGGALMVSNLPWTPMTTGNVANGNSESAASGRDWRVPDLQGQLNFIDAPATAGTGANPSNSLRDEIRGGSTVEATGTTYTDSRGLAISGGIATITPTKGPILSDLPNVVISGANQVTELVIDGQLDSNVFSSYAPYRPALVVVYTQGAAENNLTTIRLRHQNRRRMLLAIKKAPRAAAVPAINVIVESTVAAPEWHLMLVCENAPLTFTCSTAAPSPAISGYPNYFASTVKMYGGIQTNSPLIFPNSPRLFEIMLQTTPYGLIRLSPRMAWVETLLTGKL